MQLTVLVTGAGGRGVADALLGSHPRQTDHSGAMHTASTDEPGPQPRPTDTGVSLTLIASTAEDITVGGLRFCPDLDALSRLIDRDTLGGEPVRPPRTLEVLAHLRRWDAIPGWFETDDEDFARAIARSRDLGLGLSLTEATQRLMPQNGERPAAARLLPMSDDPVEAHVVLEGDEGDVAVHALEWATGDAAGRRTPVRVTAPGLARAHPAPGVLEAIRGADAVVVPLTAPVTGLGIMLGLPGMRDALRGTSAPVVGVSPTLLPSRGEEDQTLAALNLDYTLTSMRSLFADVLDGCVVARSDVAAGRFDLNASASSPFAVEVVERADDDAVSSAVLALARRMATR